MFSLISLGPIRAKKGFLVAVHIYTHTFLTASWFTLENSVFFSDREC